jgi:hypothetical protein
MAFKLNKLYMVNVKKNCYVIFQKCHSPKGNLDLLGVIILSMANIFRSLAFLFRSWV